MSSDVLEKFIDLSDFSDRDKKQLKEAFSYLDEKTLIDVSQFLTEKPVLLSILLENLKSKQESAKGQDVDFWNKIIEQEKVLLERIESKE